MRQLVAKLREATRQLLRRKPKLGEQRACRSHTHADAELALDQQCDDAPRPQTEFQLVLARVASIDPAKHLTLLRRGVAQGWHRYVGAGGDVLSVERFGASAPAEELLREYGFTLDNVCAR